jgi:hypothetical protein
MSPYILARNLANHLWVILIMHVNTFDLFLRKKSQFKSKCCISNPNVAFQVSWVFNLTMFNVADVLISLKKLSLVVVFPATLGLVPEACGSHV